MIKQHTLSWIWQSVKQQSGWILLQTLTSVFISLSYVWFALVSRRVVDMAIGVMDGNMWHQSALLLGILLAQALLHVVDQLAQTHTTNKVGMCIQERVFSRLFQKKWQSLNPYSSGDLLNRLTGDVTATATAASTLPPRLLSLLARLIASMAVLLMMDTMFAVILLAAGLLLLLLSRLLGRRIKKIHKDCQESEGNTRFFMQESIENWPVVHSFGVLSWVGRRLRALQDRHFFYRMRQARLSVSANTLVYLMFTGCYYVALAWGAWRLATGVITFGALTAFLQLIQQVQVPLRNMSGIMPQYYGMLASAERLMELEQLPDEKPADTLVSPEKLRAITVSDLTFAYDRVNVFEKANLTVKRGEFVAIAGYSGIGKSTFFKLLLGILEPTDGRVECDTEDGLVTVGQATKKLFSYVPQGNLLLSGTIRQNLTFCCEDATDDEIWEAARIAAIDDLIRELPDGLETQLGERGLGLSEGQLQRLAIARGVLYGAPVLLLDEATAALDEETEETVLANLHAIPDKTCICISHRPAALNICDRVLYVRDGRFEEDPGDQK